MFESSSTLSAEMLALLCQLFAQIQEETNLLRQQHAVATEQGEVELADKADCTYRAMQALTEAAEATLRIGL